MASPYAGFSEDKWPQVTRALLNRHPLSAKEIVDIVLESWNDIFTSAIGTNGFHIGVDIFPKPQMMGFLLNELISLGLSKRYPDAWRGDETAEDKDLVYIPNNAFSVELKTSSSDGRIYGNRSYAQDSGRSKKDKSGYYLAVNFEKFKKGVEKRPEVTLIRFGWLDHSDWQGQKAATGQQAHLDSAVEAAKLLVLYAVKR